MQCVAKLTVGLHPTWSRTEHEVIFGKKSIVEDVLAPFNKYRHLPIKEENLGEVCSALINTGHLSFFKDCRPHILAELEAPTIIYLGQFVNYHIPNPKNYITIELSHYSVIEWFRFLLGPHDAGPDFDCFKKRLLDSLKELYPNLSAAIIKHKTEKGIYL